MELCWHCAWLWLGRRAAARRGGFEGWQACQGPPSASGARPSAAGGLVQGAGTDQESGVRSAKQPGTRTRQSLFIIHFFQVRSHSRSNCLPALGTMLVDVHG